MWKPSCKHYALHIWPLCFLIAQWDNIIIHEDEEGAPSITQWTVVPGTVQALTSCLLYTHGQVRWNMRTEDMRSSLNAKLSLSLHLYISHPLSLSLHCALQPIWRLINPEGLLFRWGFPLFPPPHSIHPYLPCFPHSLPLILPPLPACFYPSPPHTDSTHTHTPYSSLSHSVSPKGGEVQSQRAGQR